MEESYENISQQSHFMDLTVSPEDFGNNIANEPKKMDRPPRKFGQINNLRSIQELPLKYQCIFEYPFFNIIQSNVLDDVLYSDVSVVISAPTGSGKTTIFELAIIRLLMNFEETNFTGEYKIVYVAPVKSLCHERLSEWHTKFSKIGLSCIVLTGDSDNVDIRLMQNYNIIITTPEKWDSLTRNARETKFLESVKLFMIDEVHLLNEDTRGPNLEVVVSRMKILKRNERVRFLAVSATIPNIEDIAQWLRSNDDPAVYFKIGEELRPVKLNKIVIGYPCASETATFKFDLTLNYKLQNILMEHAEGKPTLIFCSTRKGVELTSSHLSRNLTFHLAPTQLSILSSASSSMFSSLHKSVLSSGIGCHHAGMSLENRATVENLFREGHLPVLVATSTLAMGVNLPAHLVVVKGTKQYVGGSFQEYSESGLLQMIGRAGRPQFDRSATVVIMTTTREKDRYEKMLGGTELIESNLHRHLTDHLNAEVVLGTITDIAIALEWLRYTFLYIRVLKNPKHYNIPANFTKNQIEKKLQDWCQIEINALNKYGMLQIDQIDGFSVSPTNMGTLMANYYLAFNTMKLFMEIKGTESLSDLLMLLTKCNEFNETYLRVNDKKTLNTLNRCKYQQTIRFPLKTTIKTTPMKIYCIIQATFGCIRIQNPTLCQEAIKIMRLGQRLAKCIVIYLLHKNKYFSALLNALILYQCFNAKIWENSPFVSIQFPKIGNVLSSMLVSAGKTSFKTILETNPRDIERIINRAPPMGNEIVEAVKHLPFYKISLEPSENDKYKIKITVVLLNSDDISKKCTAGLNNHMTLLIGDSDNNILLCKKIFHHSMATFKEYVQYVDVILKEDHVVQVYLISENWVGIDCKENYDIIINQKEISTKTATNFINKNNNSDSSINQKSITSYFKTTKNAGINTENKRAKPKNNTKTIDSYFSKKNNNATKPNLGLLAPIVTANTSQNLNQSLAKHKNNDLITTNKQFLSTDSGFVSNESNRNFMNASSSNISPNNYNNYNEVEYNVNNYYGPNENTNNYYEENLLENTEGNVLTYKLPENYLENNHNFPEINYETQVINNINTEHFKQPYVEHVPVYKRLLLKYNNLSQQEDFESFSQNLARKFSQLSDTIGNNSTNLNTQNLSQNSVFSNNYLYSSAKLNSLEHNKSIAKRLENHKKTKSTLSQFKYSPPKKLSHNGTLPKIPSSNNQKVIKCSQINDSKFRSSQISLSINNEKLLQPKKSVTNEELENFKCFMQKANKEKPIKRNIPCTIISESQINILSNSQNKNINNDTEILYGTQSYEDENKLTNSELDVNVSFSDNSQSSQNNEEIIDLSDTGKTINEDQNNRTQPSFPKTFREYVQNSINKLKKSTLTNEYFNYDFGFEEFLMGPLDANSDEDSSKENEETLINDQDTNNFEIEEFENFSISSESSFVETSANIGNITFSATGENINKNENSDFKTDQYISYSPEINYQNSSFNSNIIDTNVESETIEALFKNSQNSEFSSESQNEFSEKSTLKLEKRLQMIEQFYDSPKSPIVPIKRQKLFRPPVLFPITRNKKHFKDPIKSNDTFKNMNRFKQILSTYGNHENKICLPNNNEKVTANEPEINETVKRTAYSYSVTIYEKEKKPIFNSFQTRKSKPD